MGCCHGSTAHQAVLAIIHRGVDIAAGCGDIRFQRQVGCHAPGGEIAHLVRKAVAHRHFILGEGNGQFRIFFQHLHQLFAVFLQNGYARDLGFTAGQVHAEFFICLIVVDNTRNGAGSFRIFTLVTKGFHTALDQCDLAGQIQTLKVLHSTVTWHTHQLICTFQNIHRRHIVCTRGFHIADLQVACGNITTPNLGIFHAGHAQHIVVNTGLADNGVIGMHGLIFVVTPVVAITGGIVVARCDRQNRIGLADAVVDLIDMLCTGGKTCIGAQAHVDHICAQQQCIFQCRQDIFRITTVIRAVDLHDIQLRIRCHAYHIAAFHLIGGSNTGNVGTMVAHFVFVMGDVQILIGIIEAENHLVAAIQIFCRQQGGLINDGHIIIDLSGIELIQQCRHIVQSGRIIRQIFFRHRLEILVIIVKACVDDGDLDTLAGITIGPNLISADHSTGGSGHQFCAGIRPTGGCAYFVLGLQHHLLNTGHLFDLLGNAIRHGDRNTVEQPGIAVIDRQCTALQHFPLNGSDHRLLACRQCVHGRLGAGAICRLGVSLHHRQFIHDDQDLHHLVIFNLFNFQGVIPIVLEQIQVEQVAVQQIKQNILPQDALASIQTIGPNTHRFCAGCQGSDQHTQCQDNGQSLLYAHALFPLFFKMTSSNATAAIITAETIATTAIILF